MTGKISNLKSQISNKIQVSNCKLFLLLCFALSLTGCKLNYTPKPKGYFKIDLPKAEKVVQLNYSQCDFTFQYPDYARIERDTLFFDEPPDHPCWLNMHYDDLNGIVHMSYKPLQSNKLDDLTEDYHRMKFEHSVKADFIDDFTLTNPEKDVYGLMSAVGGDVASSYQFYLTDSSKHFVRGSLYFKAHPNVDSLKPVINFVKKDIEGMIASWEWR